MALDKLENLKSQSVKQLTKPNRTVSGLKEKRRRNENLRRTNKMKSVEAYFFAPKIASFAALATRNLTTRLAAILICSPVAGLRPIRALRLTSTSFPSPGTVKLFLAFL